MEVMKPALPAEVRPMPYCWNTEAAAMKSPQTRPPYVSFFVYTGLAFLFLIPFNARGERTRDPMSILIPLKVKGPIRSAAWLWNAKVNPHNTEARTRRRAALCSFIQFS